MQPAAALAALEVAPSAEAAAGMARHHRARGRRRSGCQPFLVVASGSVTTDTLVPPYRPLRRFWFGAPDEPLANEKLWFRRDDAFDAELRARFGDDLERALRGELEDWKESPHGLVALVVLLDQLSRNIHRGTPRAFAGDARALEVSLEAQARGVDLALSPAERWFLYMPMMHAEDRDIQRRSVEAFERLAASTTGELQQRLVGVLDYAAQHRDVVERFGRFPHRNIILGRTSTADEIEFLQQPGSSF